MTKKVGKKQKEIIIHQPDDIKVINEETLIIHEDELKTLRSEEKMVEREVQGYYDVFRIEPQELFPEKYVKAVGLPKFSFTQTGKIEGHQNLVVELYNEQPVSSNILKYSKEPFKLEILLTSVDNETAEETVTHWSFNNSRIKSVDFGSLVSTMREDYRTVVCEVSFTDCQIDSNSVKLP
jgi:hypothetical protein